MKLLIPILISLILFQGQLRAEGAHEDDSSQPIGPGPKGGRAAPKFSRPNNVCPANPETLSQVANGDLGDLTDVVQLVATSECSEQSRQLSKQALSLGVSFLSDPPFDLQNKMKGVLSGNESMNKLDAQLAKSIPPLLRSTNLDTKDLKKLAGQLALISPSAARSTIVSLIQQDLLQGEQRILSSDGKTDIKYVKQLVESLTELGANQPMMASDFSDSVEEMALLSQADGLGKIFKTLGAVSNLDASFAPTFNLSATAFNRGVQKGNGLYADSSEKALLKSVFIAIQAAVDGSENLENGAIELNEAVKTLIKKNALDSSSLKKLWREVVRVLAQTLTQPALADSMALSLTPDVIFLHPEEMHILLLACRNYPRLADAFQKNHALAYERNERALKGGNLQAKTIKRQQIEPLVNDILDFDAEFISYGWLRKMWMAKLIKDEGIEKKFPRLVLVQLNTLEKQKKKVAENTPDALVSQMVADFNVLWKSQSAAIPALFDWVKRNE